MPKKRAYLLGSGSGTVGPGTPGALAKFVTSTTIGDAPSTINSLVAVDSAGTVDSTLDTNGLSLTPVTSPTAAITAVLAGSGSTNTNGAHSFLVSFALGAVDTSPQTYTNAPNSVAVTVTSTKDINLSNIPVSADPRVTNVLIWESKAGTTTPFFLVGNVANGVTTKTIALADASFGAQLPCGYSGVSGIFNLDGGSNTTAVIKSSNSPGIITYAIDESGNALAVGSGSYFPSGSIYLVDGLGNQLFLSSTVTGGIVNANFSKAGTVSMGATTMARLTGRTATSGTVATVTPTADTTYIVSANVLVTTATNHNFTVTCTYTDEGNTARTLTLNFSNPSGTIATAIANAGGTVPYEGVPMHIRAKASTAVSILTASGGTYTTVVYNIDAVIREVI